MHTTVHKRYYDVLRAQEAKQRVARRLAFGDSLAKATLTQGNASSSHRSVEGEGNDDDGGGGVSEVGACTYAHLRVVTPRVLDPIQTLRLSFTALRSTTELTYCNKAITALHPNFLQLESLEVLILRHNRLQTLHNLLPSTAMHLPPLTRHISNSASNSSSSPRKGKRKQNALSGPRGCVRLRQLLLAHNDLRDLAETDIPRLTSLEYLSLAHNRISNVTHTAQQLRKLHSLRYLDCSESPVCEEENYRAYMIAHLPQLEVLDRQVVTDEERQAASAACCGALRSADSTTTNATTAGAEKKKKGSPWKEMSVCVRLLEKQHAAYLAAQDEAAAQAARAHERAVQEVTESKAAFHAVWALARPAAAVVVAQQTQQAQQAAAAARRRSREGTSGILAGNIGTAGKAKPHTTNGGPRSNTNTGQRASRTSLTMELKPLCEDGTVVRLPPQTVDTLLQLPHDPQQPQQQQQQQQGLHESDSRVLVQQDDEQVPHESVLYDALLGRREAVAAKTCKTWGATQGTRGQDVQNTDNNSSDDETGVSEAERVRAEEAEALKEMAVVVHNSAELLRSLRQEQCMAKGNTSVNAEGSGATSAGDAEEQAHMIELTAEQKAHYCALHAAQAAMIPAPWLCDDVTRCTANTTTTTGSSQTGHDRSNGHTPQQEREHEVQLYLVQVLHHLFFTQELRAMENYFGTSEVLLALQQQPQLMQQQQVLLALARSSSTQSSGATSSTTHRSPTTAGNEALPGRKKANAAGASGRTRTRGHNEKGGGSGSGGAKTAGEAGNNQANTGSAAIAGSSSAAAGAGNAGALAAMAWAQDTQLLQLMSNAVSNHTITTGSNNEAGGSNNVHRSTSMSNATSGLVGAYVQSSLDEFMGVLRKDSGAWSLDTKTLLRALCAAHHVPCAGEETQAPGKAVQALRRLTQGTRGASEAAAEAEGKDVENRGSGSNGAAGVRFLLPSAEDKSNNNNNNNKSTGLAGGSSSSSSRGSLRSSTGRKGSKKSGSEPNATEAAEKAAEATKADAAGKLAGAKTGQGAGAALLSVNNVLGALACYVPFVQSRLAFFQAQSLRCVRQAAPAAEVKEWFDRAQAVQEHLRRLQAALQSMSKGTASTNEGEAIVPYTLLLERRAHRVGDFFAKKHMADVCKDMM